MGFSFAQQETESLWSVLCLEFVALLPRGACSHDPAPRRDYGPEKEGELFETRID